MQTKEKKTKKGVWKKSDHIIIEIPALQAL
jgi:hypothetical protein